MKWAAQLMRSKKLQKIMAGYTEQIAKVLEDELHGEDKRDLVSDWIGYPHKHSQSVSPQARNKMHLEQLQHPIWMPEKAPVISTKDGGVQTVHSKQRRHLNSLAIKNKKKKKVEVELIALEKEKLLNKGVLTKSVLGQMAIEKKRRATLLAQKGERPGMTPFQEAIHEKLQIAASRIDQYQELDDQFNEKLKEIEEDLTQSQKERGGGNPGRELLHMLTKWSHHEVYSNDDMSKYAGELWQSL